MRTCMPNVQSDEDCMQGNLLCKDNSIPAQEMMMRNILVMKGQNKNIKDCSRCKTKEHVTSRKLGRVIWRKSAGWVQACIRAFEMRLSEKRDCKATYCARSEVNMTINSSEMLPKTQAATAQRVPSKQLANL